MMTQRKIKAVAFDAVGTLIEPNPSVAEAYQRAALAVGLDLPVDLIKSRFHQAYAHDEQLAGHTTDESQERLRWRQIVARCLPELSVAQADQAFEDLWNYFAEPTSWRLFDDVPGVVQTLHQQGISVCVASNFDARLRRVWAGLPGGESLQNHLVISSEVGCRKPGRVFYDAVVAHLGFPAHEILFVGDDWVNDVEVPQKFGFETILIDRRGRMNKSESLKNLQNIPSWVVESSGEDRPMA